jgi:hypothetical protein
MNSGLGDYDRWKTDPDGGMREQKCDLCGGVKGECDREKCARCGTQACNNANAVLRVERDAARESLQQDRELHQAALSAAYAQGVTSDPESCAVQDKCDTFPDCDCGHRAEAEIGGDGVAGG